MGDVKPRAQFPSISQPLPILSNNSLRELPSLSRLHQASRRAATSWSTKEQEINPHLTPRRLIASLKRPTTLFPSAPDALKPLVQFKRIPCKNQRRKDKFKCNNMSIVYLVTMAPTLGQGDFVVVVKILKLKPM